MKDKAEPEITGIKCQKCEKLCGTGELHPCPFAEEIHDDHEDNCNCCDDCCYECSMGI